MPLSSIERPPRTLVGRVAVIATLAAIGGGFFAALMAVFLAEAAVERAEDRRLTEEATEILTETRSLSTQATLDFLRTEQVELNLAGLKVAIYRDATFVAGERGLLHLVDGCSTSQSGNTLAMRHCAISEGPMTCIIATDEVPSLGARSMMLIVLVAALVAAVLGIGFSRGLARWAVGPLSRLRGRLGDASVDESVDLGLDEGVDEIDSLRKTLRDLLTRRAEALRSARLFAAGAAHELRTPLTTLSGELELLTEEPLPDAVRLRLEGLRLSTARISELVERLLLLAAVGADEAMRHDAVELADLLLAFQSRLAPEQAQRIRFSLSTPGLVRGDESLLAVLCENVLSNALLHAAPAQVKVILVEDGSDIVLDIVDEGPGVPTSERSRLFEPFQRGVGAGPGLGLGLALVARIARTHGGFVAFVDAERGACLRLRLPAWVAR